jgi:hypothetical protein
LDDIVDAAAETLIALAAFPLVAKFVKIAAFNACRDVERG